MKALNRISVFGLGYVGLTFSICLARRGFRVIGVDVDLEKIRAINKGVPPFYEPGLKNHLNSVLNDRLFSCTVDHFQAILNSDVSFICVGTPARSDGDIDLSYIKSVSNNIGEALKEKDDYHLIVVRSTVTPGTTESVVKRIIENVSGKKCGVDFGLCMNPEFLREGSAINDIFNSDRIVIGEFDSKSGDLLKKLYVEFYGDNLPPILRTTIENAEFIKYANNAFLAMKLSFINEIANLCEKIKSCDVEVVARGIGLDKRIGLHYLKAGLGYGGSCLPKDTRALVYFARQLGEPLTMVETAIRVNEERIERVAKMAEELIGGLRGKKIAVLGLAFKENTDDVRESQAIKLIEKLKERGAVVKAYDPRALDNALKVVNFIPAKSVEEALERRELAIIATGWDEFKEKIKEDLLLRLNVRALIDARRILDSNEFSRIKFRAIGLCTG